MDETTNTTQHSASSKTIVSIIVVVLVVLVGYALIKSSKKNENGPLKVGVLLPLTGDGASYGEPARNVTQLATDEINAAGGVNGRKLELVVEDGKCNGKDGANAAQKLVNVDKVQVVIGGFCSSESLAAQPIATQAKVFLFSPGSSSPDLTGISRFFARDYPSDASQGTVLADVAFNKEGWKKVAFLQEQLDYPLGIYKAFSAEFGSLGGKIVKEEFPTSATDFRSQLTKLKAENADALFVDTQTPAASDRVLKQVQDLKWTPHILLNDATVGDPGTISKYSKLLEGTISAEFGTDLNNPKFQKLLASYKARFGADLPYQSYGQTEYDAVYMLKDGLAAVGYNGEKLADWFRMVQGWQGASGSVTIGANGDRVGGHSPEVVKDGKKAPYTK